MRIRPISSAYQQASTITSMIGGGLLLTQDYHAMGQMVIKSARKNNGGCFAILEGGYNHDVIGLNAAALMNGLRT